MPCPRSMPQPPSVGFAFVLLYNSKSGVQMLLQPRFRGRLERQTQCWPWSSEVGRFLSIELQDPGSTVVLKGFPLCVGGWVRGARGPESQEDTHPCPPVLAAAPAPTSVGHHPPFILNFSSPPFAVISSSLPAGCNGRKDSSRNCSPPASSFYLFSPPPFLLPALPPTPPLENALHPVLCPPVALPQRDWV